MLKPLFDRLGVFLFGLSVAFTGLVAPQYAIKSALEALNENRSKQF